jgi:hypothetical protein
VRTERPLFRALFHGRGFLTPNRESRQPPHVAFPAKSAGAGRRNRARATKRARVRGRARGRDRARARGGTPPRRATRRATEAPRRARETLIHPAGGYFRDTSTSNCLCRDPSVAIDRRRRVTDESPLPLCKFFSREKATLAKTERRRILTPDVLRTTQISRACYAAK